MSGYHIYCLGLLLLTPAAANAACEPSFSDSSNAVTLSPSGSLDNPQVSERFYVRLRNDGDSPCALRLSVSRDIGSSDVGFPSFTLTGPKGVVVVGSSAGATTGLADSIKVDVPAGGQVAIPYDVRLNVGWGSEAGTYVQQLVYALEHEPGTSDVPVQRTHLVLNVPSMARIRFAGAHGGDGSSLLDMGLLSLDGPTYSPPFAIRVLSTAGYQMQLVSQNAGALVRIGGRERIPYQLSVSGRPMNLAGGGDLISAAGHTSSSGDVHPVMIVVNADSTRHAGDYADRVTVTVTPI